LQTFHRGGGEGLSVPLGKFQYRLGANASLQVNVKFYFGHTRNEIGENGWGGHELL
jgi:hypothetical protein